MKLYDHLLRPIESIDPRWPNPAQFDFQAQLNQVAYFISQTPLTGSWAIVSHQVNDPVQVANELNTSHLIDGVVINLSDHAEMNHFDPYLLSKPHIVLGGDFNRPSWHPFWLIASRWWANNDSMEFPDVRKYRVGMLSAQLRLPRVHLLTNLYSRTYYSEIKHRWGHNFSHMPIEESAPLEQLALAQQLMQTAERVDSLTQPVLWYDMVGSIKHGFDESYLNIVLETYPEVQTGFISEKTFKPVRDGQLFLIQGCCGNVACLRRLGFDVYDDFIDHDYYDHEPDWKRRTEKMLEVLDNIYNNIESIYQATHQRRINNAQYLRSTELFRRILGLLTITQHRPLT